MADTPDYENGQPKPIQNNGPSMHDLLIEDISQMLEQEGASSETIVEVIGPIVARKYYGLAKYGTILQAGNGRDPMTDAVEEVVDLCVYMRQVVCENPGNDELLEAYELCMKTHAVIILASRLKNVKK